jgi:tetratricopeptide (TPR) repeat protein
MKLPAQEAWCLESSQRDTCRGYPTRCQGINILSDLRTTDIACLGTVFPWGASGRILGIVRVQPGTRAASRDPREHQPNAHGHLNLEALAELLMAAGGSATLEHALRHLLALCPVCQRGCDALRRLSREAHHPDYAIALAESREAPALWRQLAALPYASQLAAVERDETYQRWGLCRLLHRRSGEVVSNDPESAARLANLAVRIPRFLEPAYHIDSIRDLQALSFCYLGNAWRAVGEPHSAASAFNVAHTLLLAGTRDPAIAAEALALEALLLRDRHELTEAVSLFDLVEAIYAASSDGGSNGRASSDPERAGRARLHKAWCVYHLGRIGEAHELLDRTAEILDPRRQPRLVLALRCGLAWCAIALAAPDAEMRLAAAIQLADRMGDEADRLRLSRAEAHLDLMAGERGPAEETLRAAASGLLALNLGVDTALAYLDLAALYLREGAGDAVLQLAAEILPVFAAPEVGRDAMVHLLWFQQACETGKLTPGIIAGVSRGVEKSRRPSLEWWSAADAPQWKGKAGDACAAARG